MARPPKSPEKPVVLVGLMGAGKTTVGRLLAERLGLPFLDSDTEIEAATGMSVAALFERHGEAHFRELERREIARLVAGPPNVIAAGGGAFADDTSRALILDRCTAVWLDGGFETFAARAEADGGRPLLGGLGALAVARAPLYAEAHYRVRSDGAIEETVEAILDRLAGR
jgi:shikimate kinase